MSSQPRERQCIYPDALHQYNMAEALRNGVEDGAAYQSTGPGSKENTISQIFFYSKEKNLWYRAGRNGDQDLLDVKAFYLTDKRKRKFAHHEINVSAEDMDAAWAEYHRLKELHEAQLRSANPEIVALQEKVAELQLQIGLQNEVHNKMADNIWQACEEAGAPDRVFTVLESLGITAPNEVMLVEVSIPRDMTPEQFKETVKEKMNGSKIEIVSVVDPRS